MRRAIALTVAAGVLLAACGNASPAPRAPSSPTPGATSTAAAAPRACGAGATAFWLPGPGGARLEANSVGAGPDAVVFLHEVGGAGMCGFWNYAAWLARTAHVRSVLVDRCGYGLSDCATVPEGDAGIRAETEPAVAWARSHGARRVTLVGASGGGSDALQAAGVVPAVAAVVDLSGDGSDVSTGPDTPYAARVRVPTLIAVASQDAYCPLGELRAISRAVRARPNRFVVVTATPQAHGWALLSTPSGGPTPLARTVADWIAGRYA